MTRDGKIGVFLPESMAQEGLEFVFIAPSSACEKCPLYKYCVGKLESKRRYKVVSILRKEDSGYHSIPIPAKKCSLTDEPLVSVMLEHKEFEINIDKDRAIPNMSFRFDREGCTHYTCPQRPYCNYDGIPKNVKVEVVRIVKDKVDCPLGKPLKRVVIRIKEEERKSREAYLSDHNRYTPRYF